MSANAVQVKVALPGYHHTQELSSGTIELVGMQPTFVAAASEQADIADLSLLEYVSRRQSGDTTWTAVPVFPARTFVHAWVHRASSERAAAQWAGTAHVYARGLLADGGVGGQAIVVGPRGSSATEGLEPLFEDPSTAEREYYLRTGVFPILSVIAVRSELLHSERWLGSNVFRAFEVTRRRYFARLQDIRGSRVPIASVAGHLVALQQVFGPELWPHGLEQNRRPLEAFVRLAADQGLITRAPDDVAELFAAVEPFVDYTDGH